MVGYQEFLITFEIGPGVVEIMDNVYNDGQEAMMMASRMMMVAFMSVNRYRVVPQHTCVPCQKNYRNKVFQLFHSDKITKSLFQNL